MNITIYSKDNCPNCVSAKRLLDSKGLDYTSTDLSDAADRELFCATHPGVRQMPAIYINDQYVGGLAGLQAALRQLGL